MRNTTNTLAFAAALALTLGPVTGCATFQDRQAALEAEQAKEEVRFEFRKVTGTRFRQEVDEDARIMHTASPVRVIKVQELNLTGHTTLREALRATGNF